MRFGWVGFHREGLPAFQSLLEAGAPVRAAITLPPQTAATRSGATDYAPLCRHFQVPCYEVVTINDPVPRGLLRALSLDVVFVIGWSEVPDHETLETARIGMIGSRPSLVPRDRGSASQLRGSIPGEYAIAHALVWLGDAAKGPRVIDQTEFPITPYDSSATLSERVAAAHRDMVRRMLPQLLDGESSGAAPAPESPQRGTHGAPQGRPRGRARLRTPTTGEGPHAGASRRP